MAAPQAQAQANNRFNHVDFLKRVVRVNSVKIDSGKVAAALSINKEAAAKRFSRMMAREDTADNHDNLHFLKLCLYTNTNTVKLGMSALLPYLQDAFTPTGQFLMSLIYLHKLTKT